MLPFQRTLLLLFVIHTLSSSVITSLLTPEEINIFRHHGTNITEDDHNYYIQLDPAHRYLDDMRGIAIPKATQQSPRCLNSGYIAVTIYGIPVWDPSHNFPMTTGVCRGLGLVGGAFTIPQVLKCLHSKKSIDLVGVALDGYPIYKNEGNVNHIIVNSIDLDMCHGRIHSGKYMYHLTDSFPYMMSCYRGQVVSNSAEKSHKALLRSKCNVKCDKLGDTNCETPIYMSKKLLTSTLSSSKESDVKKHREKEPHNSNGVHYEDDIRAHNISPIREHNEQTTNLYGSTLGSNKFKHKSIILSALTDLTTSHVPGSEKYTSASPINNNAGQPANIPSTHKYQYIIESSSQTVIHSDTSGNSLQGGTKEDVSTQGAPRNKLLTQNVTTDDSSSNGVERNEFMHHGNAPTTASAFHFNNTSKTSNDNVTLSSYFATLGNVNSGALFSESTESNDEQMSLVTSPESETKTTIGHKSETYDFHTKTYSYSHNTTESHSRISKMTHTSNKGNTTISYTINTGNLDIFSNSNDSESRYNETVSNTPTIPTQPDSIIVQKLETESYNNTISDKNASLSQYTDDLNSSILTTSKQPFSSSIKLDVQNVTDINTSTPPSTGGLMFSLRDLISQSTQPPTEPSGANVSTDKINEPSHTNASTDNFSESTNEPSHANASTDNSIQSTDEPSSANSSLESSTAASVFSPSTDVQSSLLHETDRSAVMDGTTDNTIYYNETSTLNGLLGLIHPKSNNISARSDNISMGDNVISYTSRSKSDINSSISSASQNSRDMSNTFDFKVSSTTTFLINALHKEDLPNKEVSTKAEINSATTQPVVMKLNDNVIDDNQYLYTNDNQQHVDNNTVNESSYRSDSDYKGVPYSGRNGSNLLTLLAKSITKSLPEKSNSQTLSDAMLNTNTDTTGVSPTAMPRFKDTFTKVINPSPSPNVKSSSQTTTSSFIENYANYFLELKSDKNSELNNSSENVNNTVSSSNKTVLSPDGNNVTAKAQKRSSTTEMTFLEKAVGFPLYEFGYFVGIAVCLVGLIVGFIASLFTDEN